MKRILILAVVVAGVLSGCGEKIAIPQAEGLFSVTAYTQHGYFEGVGARQLTIANSALFVIGDDGRLTKRNHGLDVLDTVEGLADPTAVTHNEAEDMIFVWEAGESRLSAWASADFAPLGAVVFDGFGDITNIATNTTGVEEFAPDAMTYVYLSDVENMVVHRVAWYGLDLAFPAGILCRDGGLSARSVHLPAAMVADSDGMMLVCDADTGRNWVNRFDPTPDPTDVTADEEDIDPNRGIAVIFSSSLCAPPSVADHVLGNAPECTGDWEGGPSDLPGEFFSPVGVDVDGQGWIYVSDRDNSRIQIFEATGNYVLHFGDLESTPTPSSIGIIDQPGPGSEIHYGAFIYFVTGDGGDIAKFISHDHFSHISTQPWPGD